MQGMTKNCLIKVEEVASEAKGRFVDVQNQYLIEVSSGFINVSAWYKSWSKKMSIPPVIEPILQLSLSIGNKYVALRTEKEFIDLI